MPLLNTSMSRIGTILFKLLCLSQIVLLISIAVSYNLLISIFSYVILIISYILFVISFIIILNRQSKDKIIYFIILTIISLIISLLFSSYSYRTLVSVLLYFSMISVWSAYKIVDTKRLNILLSVVYIIISVLLIYLSTTDYAYETTINFGPNKGDTYIGDDLTFGFNNPNEAGIILYFVIVTLTILSIKLKSRLRGFFFILILVLIYLLLKTSNRSSLISLVFVYVLYIFNRNSFSILKKKWILIALILFSLFFALVYIIYGAYYSDLDKMFLGKPLFSGREILFLESYNSFVSSPIIGDVGTSNFGNSLNGLLTILVNTGLIGLGSYLFFAKYTILSIARNIQDKSQLFAFLSIIGVFINASTESVVLVGGGQWYAFLLTIFLLSSDTSTNDTTG